MTTPLNHDEAHDLRNMVQEVLNERDRLRESLVISHQDNSNLTVEVERLKAERDALLKAAMAVCWSPSADNLNQLENVALKIGEKPHGCL